MSTRQPILPIQREYLDYLAANDITNDDSSKSYLMALDLITAALKEVLRKDPNFSAFPDVIWTATDPDVIHRMYVLTRTFGGKNDFLHPYFAAHGQTRYLRSSFCAIALNAYTRFLAERDYVGKVAALAARPATSGAELAARIEELPVAAEFFFPDYVRAGSYQAEEIAFQVKQRLGRAAFRRMVVSLYGGKCAVCGLDVPETLRASHIIPWTEDTKNRLNPENGICLSATYDAAFVKHLISFDADYRLILSPSLHDHATNAAYQQHFAAFEGKPLTMPVKYLPSQAFLAKHREQLVG